jgi:hypothetical protein
MTIKTIAYLAVSLSYLDAKAGQQAVVQSKRARPHKHVRRLGKDGVERSFYSSEVETPEEGINRFWSMVAIKGPDDCWLFSKPHNRGYGKFSTSRRAYRAHRFAWQSVFGPPPAHLAVCHECDTRLCCNPRHLFLAKSKLNTYDAWRKGRLHGRYCRGEVTPEFVEALKAQLASGLSQAEVGRAYGLEQATVSRLVRGLQKRLVKPLSDECFKKLVASLGGGQ